MSRGGLFAAKAPAGSGPSDPTTSSSSPFRPRGTTNSSSSGRRDRCGPAACSGSAPPVTPSRTRNPIRQERPRVAPAERDGRFPPRALGRWFTQPALAAELKTRRYEWGLLQGLWQANPAVGASALRASVGARSRWKCRALQTAARSASTTRVFESSSNARWFLSVNSANRTSTQETGSRPATGAQSPGRN